MQNIFTRKFSFLALLALLAVLTANVACAGSTQMMAKEARMASKSHSASVAVNIIGVQGYDLVSYYTNEKPLKGNGNHVVEHHGVTYLFINKENQEQFAQNPHKYLPAFGGYCAYGVAVGKKFAGDPDVWKIVDEKLYLNLDNKIQGIWNKDVSGNIRKAEANWPGIKHKKAADL